MAANQRADARHNYARILAVAATAIAEHGPDASLERIARDAGLGSATVRRHFPSRRALLEAVFQQRIETLCDRARELADEADSRSALLTWLDEVVAYAASARALAAVLTPDGAQSARESACAALLETAAEPLRRRAARDGVVAEDVTIADLMALIAGITLASEHHPDPLRQSERLFRLAMTGVIVQA